MVTSGSVIARSRPPVHFHALSPRALGILAVRGLRAAGVRAGLLSLRSLRPGTPLLRPGLRERGAPGEPPRSRGTVPAELRRTCDACGAPAAMPRAPSRESDASPSRRRALVRDGARLASDERHGGAARDGGPRPCSRSPAAPAAPPPAARAAASPAGTSATIPSPALVARTITGGSAARPREVAR